MPFANNSNVPLVDSRHKYCFLDVDIDQRRAKLATAAAFVDATNSRYGFSSKHLLSLGGSELSRIPELIENDHEWSTRNTECGGILTKPPICGNRMILRLFWDAAPLACENFATLCGNGSLLSARESTTTTAKVKPVPLGESGKPLTFRKSKFHRVIPGFVMQGGDFVFQNGTGGESIFGKKFKDERAGLQLKHDRRGILSMGNSGKNSNGSQFFLTFDRAPQCDGNHVIFGELVSGFEILDAVEPFGTLEGEPTVPITITDCGIYVPLKTPACGYHYDTPDAADSFTGISPVFVVRPRVLVLAPSPSAFEKMASALGNFVSIVDCILLLPPVVSAATTTATKPNVKSVQESKIMEMLEKFVADVVIVAPVCWNDVKETVCLPHSWEGSGFELDQVFLVAKPTEALSKLHSESWLRRHRPQWQLDGTI